MTLCCIVLHLLLCTSEFLASDVERDSSQPWAQQTQLDLGGRGSRCVYYVVRPQHAVRSDPVFLGHAESKHVCAPEAAAGCVAEAA